MDYWGPIQLETQSTSRASARIIKEQRGRLQSNWDHDTDFFKKFFPVTEHIREIYEKSKKGLHSGKRWSRILRNPRKPSQLYTHLNTLLNTLLHRFGLSDDHQGNRRLWMNTSKTRVQPQVQHPVWPSLLLTGSGKEFLTSRDQCPSKHYASAISPVEVQLEHQDAEMARDRLATSMQRLISSQHNRRYAFGLVISQETLVVYMFDRSGGVSSPSLDYHREPAQFCAIVAGLASHDTECIGFDPSIYKDGNDVTLHTREPAGRNKFKKVRYDLLAMPYYASDLVGRGTICFAACDHAEPQGRYVIKDSWISPDELEGKESEASLIAHARSLGVLKGIPLVRHSEDVHIGGRADGTLDTVINNRQLRPTQRCKIERVHQRLIMSPFGKPLHRFSNREELLIAYRDALRAHRNLYEVAGILHRDIKPANILINPRGDEGNRGVLIDYDHAIRVADKSPYSTKKKIGTYLFMSRRALEGTEPNTYMDDLESFYYVLLYLGLMYIGPGLPKKELPPPLSNWYRSNASRDKSGFLLESFDFEVEPWLGQPFQSLLDRIHSVFCHLIRQEYVARSSKQPPPPIDNTEIYDKIISYVCGALDDLSREHTAGGGTISSDVHATQDQTADTSGVLSWIQREGKQRDAQPAVLTMAANRSRRDNAGHRTRNPGVSQQHLSGSRRETKVSI